MLKETTDCLYSRSIDQKERGLVKSGVNGNLLLRPP
jgi:hypothetical protein